MLVINTVISEPQRKLRFEKWVYAFRTTYSDKSNFFVLIVDESGVWNNIILTVSHDLIL